MKKYGIILADNGSDWFISGAHDSRWDDNILGELKSVPGSAFEAVDVSSLMVDADSAVVAGFLLRIEPSARAITPSERTTFAVQSDGVFTGNITLTVTVAPVLSYTIRPAQIAVPAVATLTLTDTHSGAVIPGIIHTVTVTATGGGYARTTTVQVLVGGWRVYLPLILR